MSPTSTTRIKELLERIDYCALYSLRTIDAGELRAQLDDILVFVDQIRRLLDDEDRVEYVVQRKDALNEAKGAAIAAINAFRRGKMTSEQVREQAERDNDDLFGTKSE